MNDDDTRYLCYCAAAVMLAVVGMLNDTAEPADDPVDPSQVPHRPRRLDPKSAGKSQLTESEIPVPLSWAHRDPHDVSCYIVDVTDTSIRKEIEDGIRATGHKTCGNIGRAKVLKVERIENMALWKQYWHRKREMVDAHSAHRVSVRALNPTPLPLGSNQCLDPDKLLDTSLNEVFLYHGTHLEVAQLVSK